MTSILVSLLFCTTAPRAGFGSDLKSRKDCGLLEDTSSAAYAALITVDPRDAHAIMTFLDTVRPFPKVESSYALRDTLISAWRSFRPGLSEIRAAERLPVFGEYALTAMRDGEASARQERSRLQLAWLTIVRDVAESAAPAVEPEYEERLRAMSLPNGSRAEDILRHVSEINGRPVGAPAFLDALRALYARHLPTASPPTMNACVFPPPVEIKKLWSRYVAALAKMDAEERKRLRAARPRSKHLKKIETSFEAAVTPEQIIGHLIERYPDVPWTHAGALGQLLDRFRAEHQLPAAKARVLKNDLKLILYDHSAPATDRLDGAWREIKADLTPSKTRADA